MDHPHHRREFVRTLALGSAAAVLPLGETSRLAEADDSPPKAPAAPEPMPSEADARMQIILARYGPQLDEAARKAVRQEVESLTRRAEQLRKFALENGDGPFPVFHPYRAPIA
ncbi:MAG: hypothetical protein U0794_19805 [Isosphaeraceae bacterium]